VRTLAWIPLRRLLSPRSLRPHGIIHSPIEKGTDSHSHPHSASHKPNPNFHLLHPFQLQHSQGDVVAHEILGLFLRRNAPHSPLPIPPILPPRRSHPFLPPRRRPPPPAPGAATLLPPRRPIPQCRQMRLQSDLHSREHQRLRSLPSPRCHHSRRRIPPRLHRRRPLHPPTLPVPGEYLLPLPRLRDQSTIPCQIHLPAIELQGLLLRSGDRAQPDLHLGPPSPRATPQLRQKLPRGSSRELRGEGYISRFGSSCGGRHCETVEHQFRF